MGLQGGQQVFALLLGVAKGQGGFGPEMGQQLKEAPSDARVNVARAYYARISHDADALAPLEVQCDWLREIGFENVDCYLKVLELAVFGGQRPGRIET